MIPKIRAACIQIGAGEDLPENKKRALKRFHEAVRRGAGLIVFPENFLWRGRASGLLGAAAQTPGLVREFQALAKKNHTAVLLGSLLEKAPGRKCFNTSFLISSSGKIAAKYRKIHLFDSKIKGARVKESSHVAGGSRPAAGVIEGIKMGLSVCYDLRFPELYRILSNQGCRILFVPSNFTETTGKAHWEILLRARAIENLSFVIAPGQVGVHPENRIRSFGTSLVIDPWGTVLARGSRSREEVLIADLDFKEQGRLRARFPVLMHRRLAQR